MLNKQLDVIMSDNVTELKAALKRAQQTEGPRYSSHLTRNARDHGVGVNELADYRETCERGHTTRCPANRVPVLALADGQG